MIKKIFLLVICTFSLVFYAQASEMKTGDERQTLEQITQPSWTRNDQELNEKVRTALKEDVSLREFLKNIQLKTENNVVYVRGNVATQREKKAIEDKVRTYPGVTEFNSDIKVTEN